MKDGGVVALVGFLYQLLGSAARLVAARDDPLTILHLEQSGEDALLSMTASTQLVQFKYSGTANSLGPADLSAILSNLEANDGQACHDWLLVTNRPLSPGCKLFQSGTPPNPALLSQIGLENRVILKRLMPRLRIKHVTFGDLRREISAYGRLFGLDDHEIESGSHRLLGEMLVSIQEHGPGAEIRPSLLDSRLVGLTNPRSLQSATLATSLALDLDTVARDELRGPSLDDVLPRDIVTDAIAAADQPVVIVTGLGGCGKTLSVLRAIRDHVLSRQILGGVLLSDHSLVVEDLIARWRSPDHHVHQDRLNLSLRRVRLANAARDDWMLVLELDGLDEHGWRASGRIAHVRELLAIAWKERFSVSRSWLKLVITCRNMREIQDLLTGTGVGAEDLATFTPVELDLFRDDELRQIAARTFAGQLPEWLFEVLGELCQHDNDQLRVTAAGAIVERHRLAQFRVAVESCAMLRDGKLTSDVSKATSYQAYLMGVLSAVDSEAYATAAAEVVRSAWTLAASEVLRGASATMRSSPAPLALVDAIVHRIRTNESATSAEMFLFDTLAELAPDRLLDESWNASWHEWMADSREAFVKALPDAVARANSSPRRQRAIMFATHLLDDGAFAVRRSAARTLSNLDQHVLRKVCEKYMRSGSILLRERAAEYAAWLPADAEDTLDNTVLRKLASDEERRVRHSAGRAVDELRHRTWAAEHLRAIASKQADPNAWVLSCNASGTALSKIGDDLDIEALRSLARTRKLPPNVRHWYRRLLKDLDRQWRETTRKWPDPWLPWRGAVEEFSGRILFGMDSYEVRFSLWIAPPSDGDDLAEWGGAATFKSGAGSFPWNLLMAGSDENARLQIEGRSDAEAVVVRSTGSELLLSGSGPYPSKIKGTELDI